ncbi:MAG TPA: hypothetical protein VFO07_00440, partial [Roseiflexaceae bacterium]|nr:hypothetical protein [Roseiflexaceae bacterium]
MRDLRQMAVSTILRLWSAALLVAIMLIVPEAARAARGNPTTAAELATAINDANAGHCANNTVTLVAGTTYTFTAPNHTGDGFSGDAALPQLTGTVIIEGNGATLTQGGNPVPNQQVSFTLNGSPVGTATTNESGVATLSNVSLSGIGAGNYPGAVQASFAGTSPFQASSGNASLTVNQAAQTISFDTPAGDPTYACPIDSTFSVGGSASSGLPVSFSVTSGPCSLSGTSVTISGAGTCVVQASQAGDTNYKAAPSVIRSFTITSSDATAPLASPSQDPAANSAGWNNSDVTVSWNWVDEAGGSGIDSANCTNNSTSSGEGEQALSATCADQAGNQGSATYAVKVDKTAPTISAAASSAPNAVGWYNAPVTFQFSCADALSGVTSASVSQTVSTEGADQSASGTCTDNAGNSASDTQTGINIDTTAPTLAPTVSPSPVRLGSPASASPNATDALSGIASQSCGPLDTSSLGLKSVSCTATDSAGNSASASISYEVLPPGCGGQTATIYVNPQGRIVGGKDNGKLYAGLLNGTTGNDVIVGTAGNDHLDAKAGNDILCGLGGDDQLTGDDGADIIYGGEGRDTLKGSAHNDTMYGEGGDDNLDGDSGNDTLDGGAGADFLDGDGDNDTLSGGANADI